MAGVFPPSQRDVNIYVPDILRTRAKNAGATGATSGSRLMRSIVV
jgi:hypothetical protein